MRSPSIIALANLQDTRAIVTDTLTSIHTYINDAIYTETLTVTDNDGGVGSEVLFCRKIMNILFS